MVNKPHDSHIVTKPAVAEAALSAGDFANVNPATGKLEAITSGQDGQVVVCLEDAAIGDTITVQTRGLVKTLNGKGSAILMGERVAPKDAVSVDAGTTGDTILGRCQGPLASNADAGEVWVDLDPSEGVV